MLLADHDEDLLVLTLSEPARRNPLTPAIADEIVRALEAVEAGASVRAVVIRGAGGYFSSGGDLRAMPPQNAASAEDRMRSYAALITAITRSPLPIVCALEGNAAGIAVGVAMACDVIVAADDAHILLPFSRLGLFPDGGIAHGLAARIGPSRAKSLLLLGDAIPAVRAYEIGLVDSLASPRMAPKRAVGLARELAARAPLAVAGIKRAFAAGVHELGGALERERAEQSVLYFTADFAEGKAAFFEKRSARFIGS